MDIAVIGGGAAGFFSAIHAKENYPDARVVILEKSKKVLSKVKISGGGRCNVTNGCRSVPELIQAYPRGGKKLRKAFEQFNTVHTFTWFESRGIPLITEEDGRVFPSTNTSQTIIDCLTGETKRLGIPVLLEHSVSRIHRTNQSWTLALRKGANASMSFDKVIVATGGSPTLNGLTWLEDMGHSIQPPVPSLFTFNMPGEDITRLMGVTVQEAHAQIQSTKLRSEGPILITHWGMSGPAILKLSAFGARILHDMGYSFNVQVCWQPENRHEVVYAELQDIAEIHPKKHIASIRPYQLPRQLWMYLLEKSSISPDKRWEETGKKTFNKLATILTNDIYPVNGKTTFKEEFVTCGGVDLQSVNLNTMQSRVCPGLYFAGEVLDIDGITGGYNFQAAWTTGFIAGQLNS